MTPSKNVPVLNWAWLNRTKPSCRFRKSSPENNSQNPVERCSHPFSPPLESFSAVPHAELLKENNMLLKVGEKAPSFSLPDADMETIDLARFQGQKHIVIFFYPKDGTPCCTKEVTDFSDHEDDFLRQDCVLFGVSRDD